MQWWGWLAVFCVIGAAFIVVTVSLTMRTWHRLRALGRGLAAAGERVAAATAAPDRAA